MHFVLHFCWELYARKIYFPSVFLFVKFEISDLQNFLLKFLISEMTSTFGTL